MIRISNRTHSEHSLAGPQVHYVDRIVEVQTQADPIIQTIENRVEVPVDRIIEVEKLVKVPVDVDLSIINTHISNHEEYLQSLSNQLKLVAGELEMQRRALVAIKTQRDIDRNRRLMLMNRIKKEHKAHKKSVLKFKLAIGASLLLSIVSLIVKL